MDECYLLNQKIQQFNHINEQQKQKYLFQKKQFSYSIKNL